MLMWYIIFVLLILFTGGGLLYLGTRAAKFVLNSVRVPSVFK